MKIGILTGGGDCPGLNAVIRAVVRKGIFHYSDEFTGFIGGSGAGDPDLISNLYRAGVADHRLPRSSARVIYARHSCIHEIVARETPRRRREGARQSARGSQRAAVSPHHSANAHFGIPPMYAFEGQISNVAIATLAAECPSFALYS